MPDKQTDVLKSFEKILGVIDIIFGLFWGDEGKGKIIDYLIGLYLYAAVIRANGGSNAGHTIIVKGKKTILHVIPSGIEHKNILLICGSGMVIHPDDLLVEIAIVKAVDKHVLKRLYISEDATISTPWNRFLDALRENTKGNGSNGSTKKGIAQTYSDDVLHVALRYIDVALPERQFEKKYRKYAEGQRKLVEAYYPGWITEHTDEIEAAEKTFLESIRAIRKKVKITDTVRLANELLKEGKHILIEGAQGVNLDTRHGFYPGVTSSHTTPAMLLGYAGLPISSVRDTIAVSKWYITKVGDGETPSLMEPEVEELVRKVGDEFGATTKRPRKCLWMDELVLEYALLRSHPTKIFINKMDVCPVKRVKVATGYVLKNKKTVRVLSKPLSKIKSVEYAEMNGWPEIEEGTKTLPAAAVSYLNYLDVIIKKHSPKTIIAGVGVGRDREAILRWEG